MASEHQVKEALQQLLKSCDMNTMTTRNLIEKLSEQMGEPLTQHKAFIKGEIQAYLDSLEDEEEDEDDEPILQQHGKKRTAGGEGRQTGKKAKSSGGAASGSAADELASKGYVDLSDTRRAEVSEYKGTKYCNIREYYQDKNSGEWKPGAKGIALPAAQFQVLFDNAEDIDVAFVEKNHDFNVQLAAKRRVNISNFKGQHLVNIREYYEKEGELMPGKKGIALQADQWAKLKCALPTLNEKFE